MKPKHKEQKSPVPPRMLPKLCGADIELGNFCIGKDAGANTAAEAARALLAEIDGLPRKQSYAGANYSYKAGNGYDYQYDPYGYNPQDWGRKWLNNGSCIYIDLNHLELCLPEVISAYDHLAAWHAMLRIARRAMHAANEKLPAGQKYQVLVNNSDGQSHSYGSHLDFLVTRCAWEEIFHRKVHPMLYLAAFQASSICFTGQGKVGSENGRAHVPYQLTQRVDFMETLTGEQTTYRRPIVNSRDEALCGKPASNAESANEMARLHVIFFDNTLCHGSSLLKVGTMQIILAMIEAGRVDCNLLLDDPLAAAVFWSRDPNLAARSRMLSGNSLTAVELQLLFLEQAKRFVEAGGCNGVVPRAEEIIALWEDTLVKLKARDFSALAPRLDWLLKLTLLERAMRQRPELNWRSPEIKHLDFLYGSLDLTDGLYWAYEKAGAVERLVSDEAIERFVDDPPEDTRAYTRGMLLRNVDPDKIDDVDWDQLRFSVTEPGKYWRSYKTLSLADPLGFTRAETEELFNNKEVDLKEIMTELQGSEPEVVPTASTSVPSKYLN